MSDPSAPTAAENTPEAWAAADSFPFRYYGALPQDWYEGANCGHELQLWCADREPDAATLLTAFAAAAGAGVVACSAKAKGRALQIIFGEDRAAWAASPGEDDPDLEPPSIDRNVFFESFWPQVRAGVLAVHALCPLAAVVLVGVRERQTDPWTQWSLRQGPPPASAFGKRIAWQGAGP